MKHQESPKNSPQFSIVILAFNEILHLPRLLESIRGLNTKVYVCDSGSTDGTLDVIKDFGAEVVYHPFETHPKQWDFALNHFKIDTPWIIGLDSDHIVLPELYEKLKHFSDEQIPAHISGIYFNRKNYFKGRWIKHGGYFPKYLMKMFRNGVGYSDLNENMDHRFVLKSGETMVWKEGYLKEENLKENKISFWIDKHNRYSDLTAAEEVERKRALRAQVIKPRLFGSPDERTAYLKRIWWDLPLFLRPFIYFFHRYFIQLGILDGKEGLVFHFLQALWFRFVVDVKIWEIEKEEGKAR
ncbi:glycosyltransferase [Marinilongibacter aquaticus]|uniref:glycosyltransferase family 2 protein n=1 Tax=Marinilongibacter aquaticus TaxID=2975157 RepID=UPI0021BDB3ED|nr:glycosyltransferase family 2 protein [Marinilongibacter aquaticus]UBM59740.1 glycosyltransferase [Marinilongibacter aquaticus]